MIEVHKKVARRLLPLLLACYVLSFVDRVNVGFAKLHFAAQLDFSESVFGLGAGIFYLGYSLFEIPSNLMLRRVGARATILRIMTGWGVASAAFALMQLPWHYHVLRFLLGAAEAGFFPGVLLYISFWVPRSRRAAFTANFMAAIAIAGIVGGPLSTGLMQGLDGLLGLAGWRWMFIVEGFATVIVGIVAWARLSDHPADAAWLAPAERAALVDALREEPADRQLRTSGTIKAALAMPALYGLMAMAISLLAGGAGLLLWMPTLIAKAGVNDVVQVGLFSAGPFVVAILVQRWIARRSDRLGERRWHAAIASFVAALGFALLPWAAGSLPAVLAVLTMIACGYLGATGPFWTLPSTCLTGRAAAAGIALVSTAGAMGSFVSPTLVGYLADATGSLNVGLYYYAGVMALGPLVLLVTTRPR